MYAYQAHCEQFGDPDIDEPSIECMLKKLSKIDTAWIYTESTIKCITLSFS